ncbi:MAG: phosphoribosylamine---glycine ligase [Azoarcus sp.]|nr:phosphoribosylamine---glycine ligase [Azoarcus sp.]
MKILLIDVYSCFLDFALRCLHAGHDVRWFQGRLKDGTHSSVGNGLVPKVRDWESSMPWADLVVLADNVKYLPGLEGWRKRGAPIFGPSVETALWELDRAKGQQVLADHGIQVMESIPFRNVREAQEFLLKNPRRFVSKPNADDNKALSYVSKSARDMMFMLEKWAKEKTVKTEFIFQEFVPGIEMAVGGWMGKNGFVGPWLENFEHKKLMDGDIGVNTGEMGTVLKYTNDSLLAAMVLEPLEPELIRHGYTGYIDVSVMIDKKGTPWPLEFTCRPGWPLQQILQCLHTGDPAQWMLDALQGRDTLTVKSDIATGVVMAIPDFPYSRLAPEAVSGFPVYGWENVPEQHFHPAEMAAGQVWEKKGEKLVKEPGLVTSGSYVCVVTGSGKTVEDSRTAAYRNLKKIELPNSPMYRTDIGARVEKQLPELQKLGFCEDW